MKVHSNKTPDLICTAQEFLKMYQGIHGTSIIPEADEAAEQACLNAEGPKTCEEWEDLYRGTWDDATYCEEGIF